MIQIVLNRQVGVHYHCVLLPTTVQLIYDDGCALVFIQFMFGDKEKLFVCLIRLFLAPHEATRAVGQMGARLLRVRAVRRF